MNEIAELAAKIFKFRDMNRGIPVPYLLTIGALLCLVSCQNHRDPLKTRSKYFVVMHAERYPGFNGHLTWYGRIRAGALAGLLADSGVRRIYVTPYSRTLETADSLRLADIARPIDTAVYLLDTTGAELQAAITANGDYGRTLLIVGEGFAIPGILKKLGVTAAFGDSARPDLLYEVINDHGKAWMKTIRFGPAVLPDTTVSTTEATDG